MSEEVKKQTNFKGFRWDSLTSFVEDMTSLEIRKLLLIGKQLKDLFDSKKLEIDDILTEGIIASKAKETREYIFFDIILQTDLVNLRTTIDLQREELKFFFNMFKVYAKRISPVPELTIKRIEKIAKDWKLE